FHFNINNVFSYSGGTEATAMFSKVGETLMNQGLQIQKLNEAENSVYAVKYDENSHPIICFSKKYDDSFNPISEFAAIMTCSSADQGCPFIVGADVRLPIRYEDPKAFDGTDLMNEKYAERSLEIASEMFYVFSNVNNGK
ncbi:MAG: protein-tyrosine-phosphatase, partial [Flavobacterium sp.]